MATITERHVSDFDLVLSWAHNQRVRADPTVWTGKASIYAHYCDQCRAFRAVPEPESVFWPRLHEVLRHDSNRSLLMLDHRGAGAIHLGVDGVKPLRHLTAYDDPYAPPSIAVVPSGRW